MAPCTSSDAIVCCLFAFEMFPSVSDLASLRNIYGKIIDRENGRHQRPVSLARLGCGRRHRNQSMADHDKFNVESKQTQSKNSRPAGRGVNVDLDEISDGRHARISTSVKEVGSSALSEWV